MTVAKRALSNTSGSHRSTRKNTMAAFDTVPREMRDALNGANLPFAPQRLRAMLRRGASIAAAVQVVRAADPRRPRERRSSNRQGHEVPMAQHKFKVGQFVDYRPGRLSGALLASSR